MKNLIAFALVLAFLLVVSRPVQAHEDCPNCVKVRVALALAQAHTSAVAKPTPAPAPEPTVTAPAPVRIYRIGSLPPTWVPPAPMQSVVFPQYQAAPAICTPGG